MASALPMAPAPKGPLNRYRLLSPTASLRVSPLCLGAMNFGNAWKDFMGTCDQQTTESILDFFYEQVIATKYTTNFKAGTGDKHIMANFTGNGTKSLHTSVNASLKKLQTDYIDLLYVHWWDFSCSIPELMQSLNTLVTQGKVLYLGVSDTPAWVVSKANQYARDHGLRQFCVYQGRWSAASRDFEREIIPMCREEGMGIAPWGALGGGAFKTEEQRKAQEGRKIQATEAQVKISKVLESIADRKSTAITSVALAYVTHKTPYVFPIVGGRTIDHLKVNIEALNLRLSQEDIKEIESAVPFDLGFPSTFFYREGPVEHPNQVWLLGMAGTFDYVPLPEPIKPSEN
ncbi:Norsolorinic acid reductase A [Cytospora mali]|uniref:Norsolorinic acid reductase A n=1 Tax=Cytospora mali TaxID=578113 RepID=A0A194UT14_CYTMA|nr:Norsolorinic acid reductase A [Valsa mali var. pyri (nom. inval.)]